MSILLKRNGGAICLRYDLKVRSTVASTEGTTTDYWALHFRCSKIDIRRSQLVQRLVNQSGILSSQELHEIESTRKCYLCTKFETRSWTATATLLYTWRFYLWKTQYIRVIVNKAYMIDCVLGSCMLLCITSRHDIVDCIVLATRSHCVASALPLE